MQKHVVPASITIALLSTLGFFPTLVLAGPSYDVKCEDKARATELHLFDANPKTGFISAEGMHSHLPEGMESFLAKAPADPVPLKIAGYKEYEVELQLAPKPETSPPTVISKNEARTKIGTLEEIILENHSAVNIEEQPRLGAAVLVLSSGLKLRFNHCLIRGDVAVGNWGQTFNATSSN